MWCPFWAVTILSGSGLVGDAALSSRQLPPRDSGTQDAVPAGQVSQALAYLDTGIRRARAAAREGDVTTAQDFYGAVLRASNRLPVSVDVGAVQDQVALELALLAHRPPVKKPLKSPPSSTGGLNTGRPISSLLERTEPVAPTRAGPAFVEPSRSSGGRAGVRVAGLKALPDWHRREKAKLARLISVDFDEVALDDALDFLRETTGVNLLLDRPALAQLGISGDTTVSLKLTGVKVETVLKLMLRQVGAAYTLRDEVVMITSPEQVQRTRLVVVYPVADLVVPPGVPRGLTGGGGGLAGGIGGGAGGMLGGGGGGFGGGGFRSVRNGEELVKLVERVLNLER